MSKKTYPSSPTVKELKEYLDQFNDDLLVGSVGHFGEFTPLNITGIRERKHDGSGYPYIVPHGDSWRSNMRKSVDILELPIVDIGDDPD